MQIVIALITLLITCAAHAQVYKCTHDGRQIYSDTPCPAGKGEVTTIRIRPEGNPDRQNRERREHYVATNKGLPNNVLTAVLDGRIFVGMPADAATAAWGNFRKENRSAYADGVHLQWIYHHMSAPGSQKYVYIRNGVVTAIQE